MKVLHVVRLEWHCAVKHREKHDTSAPQVRFESLVTFVLDDLGRDVGRRSTLLVHGLPGLDCLRHTEVGNFDAALSIKQNIVKLYVTVQNFLAVDVANTLNNLLEKHLRGGFVELLSFADEVKHVTASAELHHKKDVAARFKCLVKLHNTVVSELKQYADLMHDFASLLLFG